MNKFIILDRDGVINKDIGDYVKTKEELSIFPESLLAIALLKKHGYKIAIATNQAGINKNIYNDEKLASIHHHMLKIIREHDGDIDQILYCPNISNQHPWRKPNPGMLIEILKINCINDSRPYFVGDTERDVYAAIAADCKPVIVLSGKPLDKLTQQKFKKLGIPIFDNLYTFVRKITNN